MWVLCVECTRVSVPAVVVLAGTAAFLGTAASLGTDAVLVGTAAFLGTGVGIVAVVLASMRGRCFRCVLCIFVQGMLGAAECTWVLAAVLVFAGIGVGTGLGVVLQTLVCSFA